MKYKEIVDKLHVKFDEEFECEDGTRCLFTSSGVFALTSNPNKLTSSAVLWELKNGYLSVKPKHWKPEFGGNYYFVDRDGSVYLTNWNETLTDALLYKIGNCYKDLEEAAKYCDEWMDFYGSNEVLEV